jgi:predicted  nucleic acid-binding Zn-ribbon protein
MTAFNSFHIKAFNQRCKSLTGEGKVVFTHKELRDLQAEILDLLCHLGTLETQLADAKKQATANGEITIELQGGNF